MASPAENEKVVREAIRVAVRVRVNEIAAEDRATLDAGTAALAALRAQAEAGERAREALERGLAALYAESTPNRVLVARLCDEYVDPPGALLGRVRRAALTGEPT